MVCNTESVTSWVYFLSLISWSEATEDDAKDKNLQEQALDVNFKDILYFPITPFQSLQIFVPLAFLVEPQYSS